MASNVTTTTCWGCREGQPNQQAHMDPGGCLYMGGDDLDCDLFGEETPLPTLNERVNSGEDPMKIMKEGEYLSGTVGHHITPIAYMYRWREWLIMTVDTTRTTFEMDYELFVVKNGVRHRYASYHPKLDAWLVVPQYAKVLLPTLDRLNKA